MAARAQSLQAEARDRYQTLHDAISHARESCMDPLERDDLRHKAEDIQAILTSLDVADLQSRTAEFEELGADVDSINSELLVLRGEIDNIVQDVAVATDVVAAIDGALSASVKLFA
jgi:hypothetical protein